MWISLPDFRKMNNNNNNIIILEETLNCPLRVRKMGEMRD
jgi:hypothetical protein